MDLIYLLLGLEVLVVLFLSYYLIKKFRNTQKERNNKEKDNFDPKNPVKNNNRGSVKK